MLKKKFQGLEERYSKPNVVKIKFKNIPSEPSPQKMRALFHFIDKKVFEGILTKALKFFKIKVTFRVDQLKQGVAGYTNWKYKSKHMLFNVHYGLFDKLFKQKKAGPFLSGGKQCVSKTNCFMSIFVHEMCHVFVYLFRMIFKHETWNQRSHGKLFSKLVKNAFGQTEAKHALLPGFKAHADHTTIRASAKEQIGQKIYAFVKRKWVKVTLVDVRNKYATVKDRKKDEIVVPISFLKPNRK